MQIFSNAIVRRSRPRRTGPWGAALTLIVIVFIFTDLARLVTAFFARRQRGMTPEDGSMPTLDDLDH